MTETDKTIVSSPKASTEAPSSSSAVGNGSDSSQKSDLRSLKYRLKTLWSGKKSSNLTELNKELTTVFAKYTQPLKEYLDFLEVIIDHGWTGSFSYYVTKQFDSWLAKSEVKPEGESIASDLKQQAMTVASKASSKDIKALIFNLYQLEASPEIMQALALQFKEKHAFLQMCHWICLFKLEDKFVLLDYLYPILLTKNCFEVINYLDGHPNSVVDVIKYADSIFYNMNDLTEQFLFYNLPVPKKYFLLCVARNIESIMKKCVKKFNVSSDYTPNLNKKMIETEIRFYVQSLSRNDMTEEGFMERINPLCENDPDRQKYLVQHLLKTKQTDYLAEYYCDLYTIDTIHPKGIQRVELEEDYHVVENLVDMIVFVDSQQSANSMLEYIDSLCDDIPKESKVPGIPVGIDTEWKSVCGVNIVRPPALLQVAFGKKVFLVDITVLHSNIDFWKQLNEKLLQNNRFIKLGYGLHDDQCKFDYYPLLSFINLNGSGSLDLLKEERKHYKRSSTKFPYDIEESGNNGKSVKGLSRLVSLCYSKPLDKREQLSDWEKRPLRPSQLLYAAMDAYCLLEVYSVLMDMHKESNMRFNVRGNSAQTSNKVRYNPEKKRFRQQFFRKRKFKNYKKVEASTQASVDSLEVSTQT